MTGGEIIAPVPPDPLNDSDTIDVAAAIELCAEFVRALSPWEHDFRGSVRHQRPLSAKQTRVLESITRKALAVAKGREEAA